jgi:mevalonate kinase
MGKGNGFGKVILFNEHFVVYGIPAIVSAIELETTAAVEKHTQNGIILNDQRPAIKGYKEEKKTHQLESLTLILKKMEKEHHPLKITLGGTLVAASGIGASAASCVAIARAINEEFHMKLTQEEINNIAFEGEKGYHGSPSGVDNTAATYGGLIWFKKGNPNVMKQLKIKAPLEIVMGNTGVVANTKLAVKNVRKSKEKYPHLYTKIFTQAKEVAEQAKAALISHDLTKLGDCMNENHSLLQKITVSNKNLDFLVQIAQETGALGAKLTGGGLGGYMVALTPGKNLQEKVAQAINREGFDVLKTRIGV